MSNTPWVIDLANRAHQLGLRKFVLAILRPESRPAHSILWAARRHGFYPPIIDRIDQIGTVVTLSLKQACNELTRCAGIGGMALMDFMGRPPLPAVYWILAFRKHFVTASGRARGRHERFQASAYYNRLPFLLCSRCASDAVRKGRVIISPVDQSGEFMACCHPERRFANIANLIYLVSERRLPAIREPDHDLRVTEDLLAGIIARFYARASGVVQTAIEELAKQRNGRSRWLRLLLRRRPELTSLATAMDLLPGEFRTIPLGSEPKRLTPSAPMKRIVPNPKATF